MNKVNVIYDLFRWAMLKILTFTLQQKRNFLFRSRFRFKYIGLQLRCTQTGMDIHEKSLTWLEPVTQAPSTISKKRLDLYGLEFFYPLRRDSVTELR